MFAGLLATVLALVVGQAFGDPCLDRNFRCRDLRAVTQCNSINECKDLVWKSSDYAQDSSETCRFCTTLVQQIRDFIADQKSQPEITQLLGNGCAKITNVQLAEECRALATMHVGSVIEVVKANVDPKSICGLLRFCSSAAGNEPSSVLAKRLDGSPSAGSTGNPLCEDCKKFFQDIKDLLQSSATLDKLRRDLHTQLCIRLGDFETGCQKLIDVEMPELVKTLTADMDPETTCQTLTCCSAETAVAGVNKCLAPNGQSVQYSLLCSTVIQQLQQKKNDIKAFFKTNICSTLTQEELSICNDFVSRFGDPFIEMIVSALELGPRCHELVTGAAMNSVGNSASAARSSKHLSDSEGPAAHDRCRTCLMVVGELNMILKFNQQKLDVKLLAERVCGMLPDADPAACRAFLQAHNVESLATLLKSGQEPITVCQDLQQCNGGRR